MLCCDAFENLIRSAGGRGLAVLVRSTDDGIKFALQMRAIAFADERALPKGTMAVGPQNLALSGSMVIRYCPSCGKRLDELVTTNAELFVELAAKHSRFQDNWGQ